MAILKMILLLGLLIFVHELGHFLVARLFKIKVDRFCFGLPFGPIIYEKKIGDVTFGIHLLFFTGGYVSFPDDNKENGLPTDSPELFKNQPIYKRACVLVAGVMANLITAYLIVFACCMHWHQLPMDKYGIYIDKVAPTAQISTIKSGIQSGDIIYAINGKEVEYPNELNLVVNASKQFSDTTTKEQYKKTLNEFLKVNSELSETSILQKNQVVKLNKTVVKDPVILNNYDIFGLKQKHKYINLTEQQKKIRDDAFNKKAYLIKEDISVKDFVEAISDTYAPINFTVQRQNKKIELPTIYSGKDGKIGVNIGFIEKTEEITSFPQALVATNNYIMRNTKMLLWSFKVIVTGSVPMKNIQGIVGVTKVGAKVIENQGLMKGFLLTAIISLNLFILNLLPIPALDGGHLIFLLIEKIKGSPVDEKFIELISNICFYLLIALTLLLVGNDILGIITKRI